MKTVLVMRMPYAPTPLVHLFVHVTVATQEMASSALVSGRLIGAFSATVSTVAIVNKS